MKKTFTFYVETGYIGSLREEEVVLEIPENLSEEEEENFIDKEYREWLWNNIDSGWYIK